MAAVLPPTTINTLQGAVALAAGSNVTLTPSGNTITVAATAAQPDFVSLTYFGGA